MKKTKQKKRELTKALLETADGMHRVGILSDAAHAKITKRHLGAAVVHEIKPLSPVEIRSIREEANMSQAVFAHCLRVTTGYVSQLERGTKHPSGPALVLLDVIKRKGIEALLSAAA